MIESQPSATDPARWSPRELAAIAVLLAFLVGLIGLRIITRPTDTARIPSMADVVVLHAAGLRADSFSATELAGDLGLSFEQLLHWPNAFAQSSDPLRSSLSLLSGDLVLDLDRQPGPSTLVPRLHASGYVTSLVTDSEALHERVAELFDLARRVSGPEQLVDESARLWTEMTDRGPSFLFVDVTFAGTPLHADTTAASELKEAHSKRLAFLRGVLAQISQATSRSSRPQLIALVGSSGLELGEHPDDTESPFDPHLRVPFILGLRSASTLPSGIQPGLIQSADLAPTLLDLLDRRSRAEKQQDDKMRRGRSLEASTHGWVEGPVHDVLYLASAHHVVARTRDWKLISEVTEPWEIRRESSRLYSLSEDPGESRDLLSEGSMGPVAEGLFVDLQSWLLRPVTLAVSPTEKGR